MTTLCLAAFAGLARPVGNAVAQDVVSVDASHRPGGGGGQTPSVQAARTAAANLLFKRVTVGGLSKRIPGLGPAFGQVDATLPGPRRNPTTTAGAATTASTSTAVKTTAPTTTRPATTTAATPTTTRAATTTTRAATTTTRAATTTPAAPTGWKTIFEDNFDGTTIDAAKWGIENRPATNMGEVSYYAPDDVFLRDGSMVIRAENRSMGGRSYTTGQATSNFNFQYGKVEFRAKMPVGQGFWPALWMLPADGNSSGWLPEIDIYESINREANYYGTYHYSGDPGQVGPNAVVTDTTAWHTYGIDWSPTRLSWTLDGQVVATTTDTGATQSHRMFLLMTFALGGSWPGAPDATTPFPSEMQIDWVRVLQQG